MGFDDRETFYNCFILFLFQGAGGIDQAASGAEVREGSLDHLTLPRLKQW